ncbi:MAG TPA: hypothetical protein VF713_03890, partial [Thermoanaerobaculia bacterium]
MTTASIGEHGIIGNMRSAALVNVFGAIDFFCFPEFDSPIVFVRSSMDLYLGGDRARSGGGYDRESVLLQRR